MSTPSDNTMRIPTRDELRNAVVPRRPCASSPESSADAAKARKSPRDAAHAERILSPEAESFLRYAAEPHHRSLTLEERWNALGVTSGSIKKRILDELRRHGLIRLERKGRGYQVHLYGKAWDYLGLPRPKGEGVGGASHRIAVKHVAALLKKRGYEVHIEREIGAWRKRVDLVAYGKGRVLGVEVGLSDARQEIKNLREDLSADVLDVILFVTTDKSILAKVKEMAAGDTEIARHLDHIRFFLLDKECMA